MKKVSKMKPVEVPHITIKAGVAIDALSALKMLLTDKDGKPVKIAVKDAFRISRLLSVMRADPDIVATDTARLTALRKYGKDMDDGTFQIPLEKMPKFEKEYGPFANKELVIEGSPLPLSLLDRLPGVEIPVDVIQVLLPLFEKE